MTITIYRASGSCPSWRVMFALELKGLPYEAPLLDVSKRQHKTAEMLAMNPRGKVPVLVHSIPEGDVLLSESSVINEYLEEYKGEGIQHIALFTDNIYETVEAMRAHDVEFLDTPDTYYEIIEERVPNHGEDLERMKNNRLLLDADDETKRKLLLQIFTQNCIGPIFFEIIQRKGNEGFGNGNFTALFESIERDQMKRGVL